MSNQLRFKCPGCQTTLQVSVDLRGHVVTCPKCQRRARLPDSPHVEVPVQKREPAPLNSLPDVRHSEAPFPANNPPFWQSGELSDSIPSPSYPTYQSAPQPSSAPPAQRYGKSADRELTEADSNLQSTGIFLVVIPILAAILPMFGLQLRRLAGAGEFAPLGAMILGFIGAGIIWYARRGRSDAALAVVAAVISTLVFGVGGFLLQANASLQGDDAADNQVNQRPFPPSRNGTMTQRGESRFAPSSPHAEIQKMMEEDRQRAEQFHKEARENAEAAIRRMQENRSGFRPDFPSQRPPGPPRDFP
ncbi:MAG: hypothetical protein ACK6DC_10585 [Planctomycetota bacterium]